MGELTIQHCPTCKSESRKVRKVVTIPPRSVGSHAFFGWEGDCTHKWHSESDPPINRESLLDKTGWPGRP